MRQPIPYTCHVTNTEVRDVCGCPLLHKWWQIDNLQSIRPTANSPQ